MNGQRGRSGSRARSSVGSAQARSDGPELPAVTLPKGGGAVRGIGEKFATNPATGTGAVTVPIATSPGRQGFGPDLSLSYDSGSGNGPFGFGWSLSLPAITRRTDRGLPRYRDAEESDVFLLSGVEDLVPVLRKDGTRFEDRAAAPGYVIHRYRPRVEGLFARLERWTSVATGETHWRSISRHNVTTLYGKDNNSRVFDPADPSPDHPTRVFRWLICESHDDKGNAIVYEYAEENADNVAPGRCAERNRVVTANRYLKRIRYANRVSRLVEPDLTNASWMFDVVLDYDEGHYAELPPDPTRPAGQQHQRARAATAASQSWTARPDPFSSYRSGFEVRTYRRCRRILMFHHIPDVVTPGVGPVQKGYDGLVRSFEFGYADLDYGEPVSVAGELAHQGSTRFGSLLRTVTESGYLREGDDEFVDGVAFGRYLKKSLPPLEFEYRRSVLGNQVREVDAASLENLPEGLDGSSYQWVDLDGEGISGLLTEQAGAWFYKPNQGDGGLGPLRTVATRPALTGLNSLRARLLDLAGDGRLDIVDLGGPTPGFYERASSQDWERFRTFPRLPNADWSDPNLRFVDLSGDGLADILITDREVFTWHPSLAEEGFGPAGRVRQPLDEERGPRLVLADGTQSTYLADMSGDGLTDLVRIRNGEVSYWPNLGHGRFGAKVTMDNAPRFDRDDQFDQDRIRLADIDGSGTTDIIYLAGDGVGLYFNQSGNRWSTAHRLAPFPKVDNIASVVAVDLLGNGTACLVWSSPLPGDARRPLRYVDLMGGTKPHLLVKSVNNLGMETELHYAPSTYFYLKDSREGHPWITRLPFPVQVVERAVTHDRVSGTTFVTRYAYHHGHFDGVEREFRGFGMVEQWDTEEFAALGSDGTLPPSTNVDISAHVPPVLTKTWFHTGAYLGRDHVSDYYAGLLDGEDLGEYYREPGLTDAQARALLLADTTLPDGLTVEEEREACRALKGSMLRQEVYALDGTQRQPHPYTVTEQNLTVRVLQRRGGNQHAVFYTHPRESISAGYERDPSDPRTSHRLTLDVDDYGNVLRSATIGYGRRQPDPDLSPADQVIQARVLISYTESSFTNAVDGPSDYRTPLPAESRTYELTGLGPADGSRRFTLDGVRLGGMTALALDYQTNPTAGLVQKRLIEHVRTYYRRDDLSGPLPLGGLQSLALPFESYRLAFTPVLVAQAYGGRVGDEMMAIDGGYVHLDSDADWWIPSGRVFYCADPAATAPQELVQARRHYFLPCRHRSPFHTDTVSTESFASYDAHDLLIEETRDAVGNRVTVGERPLDPAQPPVRLGQDYRVLQPALVMDPNRNRSAVAYDALGMVVGTAVMGKPTPALVEGDTLDGFRADLTEAETDGFLADPTGPAAATLLHGATTRIVYDLSGYGRASDPINPIRKPPAVAATIARETHVSDLPPNHTSKLQISISYVDGLGREIQKKTLAEAGPVPIRDAAGGVALAGDGQPQLTNFDISPRWVGSGWTVFNNKGDPVREFEPFFTDTHRFEFDIRAGVSTTLFYDPVRRVVATLHPDHTWEKVVFNSWRQEIWDANDTVLIDDPAADPHVGSFVGRLAATEYLPSWYGLRTSPTHALAANQLWPDAETRQVERRTAEKAAVHAGTPAVVHTDTLGRIFLTVTHNRFTYADKSPADAAAQEFHHSRIVLDVEGNQRAVIDAKDRVVMRYDYDMLGTRIHQASMEAGERWALNDVAGKLLYAWDSRGHRFRSSYDALRRPTDSYAREGALAELTVGRQVYGETVPDPEAHNLRGAVVHVFDQAGLVTSDEYDFKGNLVRGRRHLAEFVDRQGARLPAYTTVVDWSGQVGLAAEAYASRTRYDALNRPIQLVAPHADLLGAAVNIVEPIYNEANLLEQLHVWLNRDGEPTAWLDPTSATLHAVTDIDYDAKGQRTRVDYGNGVSTTYHYDRLTFRLVHLLTRRDPVAFPGDCPQPPPAGWPGCQVQNLHYTYDPVGNITHIRDDAQQTVYFRNKRVEPSADYTYDAVYRLIEATGREHLGQSGGSPIPHSDNDAPRVAVPHPGDGNAMGRYVERYVYDTVGNILQMQHRGTDPAHAGWTRAYAYQESSQLEPGKQSNRLTGTTVGATLETYSTAGDGYDPHGSMLRMPHLPTMRWDLRDHLHMTERQVVNAADANGVQLHGERTWYVYDSSGERVRKVTELANGLVKDERIYLGGFEIYRKGGANPLVRETLHLMDDKRRVALVETRTSGEEPGVSAQLIRYQFGNHLGSASLELDERAHVISYEEYTPYGCTSYQAVRSRTETPKRYRFTGKERDEESGLCYHSARYYAPWLGCWVSSDPSGPDGGLNFYAYSGSRPTNALDPSGRQPNYVDIGTDPELRNVARKVQEAQSDLDAPRPPPVPRRSVSKSRARAEGNQAAAAVRRSQGMTDPAVQAGHTQAVRHASESGAPRSQINDPATFQHLHSRKGKGLDVTLTGPGGEVKVTTRHRAQEYYLIEDAVCRARAQSGGQLTPEGHAAASEEVRWRSAGTGWDQREVEAKRQSGQFTEQAAIEQSPAVRAYRKLGARGIGFAGGFANATGTFMMAREMKIAEQGYRRTGVAILEDKNGEYTLRVREGILFDDYYKTYISGKLQGSTLKLGFFEFRREINKRNEKYGYWDFFGNFVPGKVPPRAVYY